VLSTPAGLVDGTLLRHEIHSAFCIRRIVTDSIVFSGCEVTDESTDCLSRGFFVDSMALLAYAPKRAFRAILSSPSAPPHVLALNGEGYTRPILRQGVPDSAVSQIAHVIQVDSVETPSYKLRCYSTNDQVLSGL
jgi:hypothetical protein